MSDVSRTMKEEVVHSEWGKIKLKIKLADAVVRLSSHTTIKTE
jgi:hypothetical protein